MVVLWERVEKAVTDDDNNNDDNKLAILEIAQDTAYPWGPKWGPKDPNGAPKQKMFT